MKCECGCGFEIKNGNRFINGHNRGMLNKCHSKETKIKMSLSAINKPKSEESKIKNSNAHKGKKQSKEHIEKRIKNCKGEKHYNWRGGLSYLPYCYKFNEKLKEQIRERDNRVCQECNKTELENGRKLSVHHIHYDKLNCEPDLISLCNSHNTKVNFNRDYWEEHFMEKLHERGLLNYFGET